MALSAADITSMRGTLLATMTDTAAIVRDGVTVLSGGAASVACRVAPYGGFVRPLPGFIPMGEPRWAIKLPAGTDVRTLDMLTVNSVVYEVLDVEDPRTVELARLAVCHVHSYADGSLAYIHANATIVKHRTSVADLTLRVQIFVPTRNEEIEAAGGMVPLHVYDTPTADWVTGDRLTIQSFDGITAAPEVVNYRVSKVTRVPAPLALTDLELAGGMK